jgi:hypothetical protein
MGSLSRVECNGLPGPEVLAAPDRDLAVYGRLERKSRIENPEPCDGKLKKTTINDKVSPAFAGLPNQCAGDGASAGFRAHPEESGPGFA